MSLCKVCGASGCDGGYCELHKPDDGYRVWHFIVLVICTLVMGALFGWCSKPDPVVAEPTVVTRVVTERVIITNTPMPTSTPSPTPFATPHPSELVYMIQEDAEIAADVVSSEAGGMGRTGKQLVACNIVMDFYDVAGDWDLLKARWLTLPKVLDGNTPLSPGEPDVTAVNLVMDTGICNDYPRCKFLGTTADLYTWLTMKYVEPGKYSLWLGESGQMLVCVEGTPDLPEPTVK